MLRQNRLFRPPFRDILYQRPLIYKITSSFFNIKCLFHNFFRYYFFFVVDSVNRTKGITKDSTNCANLILFLKIMHTSHTLTEVGDISQFILIHVVTAKN